MPYIIIQLKLMMCIKICNVMKETMYYVVDLIDQERKFVYDVGFTRIINKQRKWQM